MDAIDFSAARFDPDTAPLWSDREGHIASTGYYVFCAFFCWLVIPFFMGVARYLRVERHTYLLTAQRLREQSGIFFRRTEELELYRVKDISIDQPFLQRLAGCGRLVLQTSDLSTPRVILEAIPDPLAVADLIRDCVERCRVAKGTREFN